MMEIARVAARLQARPKRSLVFMAVTGEEQGLLGSDYYVENPIFPLEKTVADINIDMFLPIVPLKILRVQGINDSTLGDRASAVAQSFGVKAVADPEPLRVRARSRGR